MASALPTQLQEYVHLSRYARWRNEDNRRETWAETVQRYTDFFASKFPDTYPTELINHAIASLHVMPSMRALMTAGPALERDNMAGFNPVDGATRVVTREFGNVPISTLSGASATVLNKEGRWATATFRSYGIQPTKKVAFKRNSNTLREVVCTANHRWVLDNGTVKATEELKNGDHVAFVSAPRPAIDADYTLGVRHGVVYGDGTMTKAHRRVRGYHLRLCSDSKELLPWFDGYPVAYPPSMCGDPIVMMYDSFAATHSLKALPDDGETESYLLGFLRGWLAADGTVGKRGEPTLCCDARGVEWLRRNTERLGISITRVYQQSYITNFGVRTQPSFIVGFSRSSMLPEDQLCSWKAARIVPIKSRFVVVGIEDMPEPTEVFCAEVPDTNTFVLEGGLVTGNCAAVAIDHVRAFDEILYILMCFHPDTLVVTRNGSKRIADIVVGDEVSSIDEATGLAVWKMVTNQIKTKSALKPKVEITLDNGHTVKCTADHKWLTTNRGWVEAGDLKVSDDLTAPTHQIYRITNTLNSKAYIGQTSKTAQARFAQHIYTANTQASDWHFAKALRKHPLSVWKIEIIDFAFSKQEAHDKECAYIQQNDTVAAGYNSTSGGEGAAGYAWTDEQRQRTSENAYVRTPQHREAQRQRLAKAQAKILVTRRTTEYRDAQRTRNLGSNNPMFGKTLSPERKAEISLGQRGEANQFFGKRHSEESKQKIRDSQQDNKGAANPFFGKKHSEATRAKMSAYWASKAKTKGVAA